MASENAAVAVANPLGNVREIDTRIAREIHV